MSRVWVSICSQHQKHDPYCRRCAVGSWRSPWSLRLNRWVFAFSPKLWRWWVNQ